MGLCKGGRIRELKAGYDWCCPDPHCSTHAAPTSARRRRLAFRAALCCVACLWMVFVSPVIPTSNLFTFKITCKSNLREIPVMTDFKAFLIAFGLPTFLWVMAYVTEEAKANGKTDSKSGISVHFKAFWVSAFLVWGLAGGRAQPDIPSSLLVFIVMMQWVWTHVYCSHCIKKKKKKKRPAMEKLRWSIKPGRLGLAYDLADRLACESNSRAIRRDYW